MPPESGPWDRKDFFREKKHSNGGYDRVSEPLGGGSAARWRDAPSHGSRNDYGRWGFPSEFRRPPGHGKQGGWHLYPDDMPHGYATARSGDRFFQDGGGFRPSGPYRDGRYSRSFRESRASYNQRDWRGHSWDSNHHHGPPPSGPGRLYDGKDQKSVDVAPARSVRPLVDVANTSNSARSEEQRHESSDIDKAGACQRVEKEESLPSDWKPFKWSRPASLTARGSGSSIASSSKGAVEPSNLKIDLPLKISTPDEFSSGDAVGCLASPTSLEDTTSRKKPRLGWGEGLAKFEKKRVDGPDDSSTKSSSAQCTSSIGPMHSPVQNWVDKSPRIGGFFECISPTTPSSAAYSSSPGLDDKSYMKAAEIESDASKLCLSPTPRVQNHFEAASLNLESMDSSSFCDLNGLLAEVLQKNYSLVDSGLKKPALKKLLSWKGDISKVLELTESEIDSLENELKSLKSGPGSNNPVISSSMSIGCKEKLCAELTLGDHLPCGIVVEESLTKTKDEYIDSPGTATSKFTELSSADKPTFLNQQKHGHTEDMIFLESAKSEDCGSVQAQYTATSSGLVSETKLIQNGSASGHDNVSVCDNLEDNDLDCILVSNKETAIAASKFFCNILPRSDCDIESIGAISSTSSQNNLLTEKFLKRKRSLRFKERVLSMKYKALHYMWKEDMQLLSERKHRTKSQKKVELGLRSLHSGFQKHRSSVRSRLTSPACNTSLFPTSELVSFTSKLLSDPRTRYFRTDMKMPALILDKKEKMLSRFLSNNGLVQDPCAVEREKALINPWTAEEKKIFLDKYAAFGKDFTKISSFLDHKTTADCIDFYYKNHKSDCFKKAKKQQVLKKQVTSAPATRYLMTSEKRSKEINAANLDMLRVASAILAHDDEIAKAEKILSISGSDRTLRGNDGFREMSSSYNNIEDERETEAADVLAGICGSLSSEAMSSCITSSADPGEGTQDWKSWKTGSEPSGTRCPPTAEVTQNVVVEDDDTCSDESCGYVEPVDWTDEEKSSFVQAYSSYGKDFVMISRCVQTKSRDQCKVFFSKARKCLGLEMASCPHPGDEEMQTADDLDGGRSDTEDACVVENDEITPVPSLNLNNDDSGLNFDAPVKLDENNLKGGRSHNQECQQEISPDDGTVVNEDVENAPKLKCHDTFMAERVADVARIDNSPSSIIAEPEADLKGVSLVSHQDASLAPFGNELKQDQTSSDSVPSSTHPCVSRKETSVQPLQVYLKKCQRLASVQSVNEHLPDASEKSSSKNVKLFGQILSKPSTTMENATSDISSHSVSEGSSSLSNGSLGLENFPARNYGFWDGRKNRIPDSALLAARYPSIFGGSSDQNLPLPPVLASVASCSSNNAGFGDYQAPFYPTEQDKIQQYRLDMKQRSVVPRNGFEAVPGLQQIELNVVHGDSRPVGSCNGGLTDPVAALKLHYAKTHQQNGGGDVGR